MREPERLRRYCASTAGSQPHRRARYGAENRSGAQPPPWEENDSVAILLDAERFAGAPLAQPQQELAQRLTW